MKICSKCGVHFGFISSLFNLVEENGAFVCNSCVYREAPSTWDNEDINTASPSTNSAKKCPYCAEIVMSEAVKCKHCGEMIGNSVQSSFNKSFTKSPLGDGFNNGCTSPSGCISQILAIMFLLFVLQFIFK